MNADHVSLDDFVRLKRGYDLPERDRRTGDIPILGSFGITGRHDTAKHPGPGVTIGRSGASIGVATYCDGPYWPLNTALYVQDFKGNDPRFVYFVLDAIDFRHHNSGAAQPSLNRNYLGSIRVWCPEHRMQQAVARALGSLDDLIENNRRRIEILEEMARLIYREWFVHFRFPGHDHVQFVHSDLGRIPTDWRVAVADDLITSGLLKIGDGYRAKNAEFDGQHYAFVRVKNVREGFLDLSDVDYLPEPYGEKVSSKRGQPGDCVVSMKGTVGRMAFVGEHTPPLIYSPQISYWRSLDSTQLPSEYLRLWMQDPVFVGQCARVKGATDMADYINLRDQRAMKLGLPPPSLLSAFVETVSPVLDLSDNLRSQIEVLENARDLLLPRMISGELDVSDLDLDLEPVG